MWANSRVGGLEMGAFVTRRPAAVLCVCVFIVHFIVPLHNHLDQRKGNEEGKRAKTERGKQRNSLLYL